MDESTQLIWNDVLELVKVKYNDAKMSAWLEKIIPWQMTEEKFICAAQLQWPAGLIMREYKTKIESCLQEITMENFLFLVEVKPELFNPQAGGYNQQTTQVHSQNSTQSGSGTLMSESSGITLQGVPGFIDPITQNNSSVVTNPSTVMHTQSGQNQAHQQVFSQPTENGAPQGAGADLSSPEIPVTSLQSSIKSEQPRIEVAPKPLAPQQKIQARCTFDTFITGDSNAMAVASAKKVAQEPGHWVNPFFLYSKSGLGKTHLLMAIQNYTQQYYPDKKTLYVTSEQFVRDYVKEIGESKKKQTGQPIMTNYRSVDVLLVDDIQFLENKSESQEYFFATFNHLYQRGTQIVLAADRSPKELKMDERMTSRFLSGLCQDIQIPSFELKLAILQNNYKRVCETETWYQANLSDELLRYIAEISSSNIREIEGFLNRVMVLANNKNKQGYLLTKADISQIASEQFDIQRKIIEISTIQREVERRYGISHDDMVGSKRTKNINFPRQIAMYLCRELTDEVFASIGKKFGGRDHTTIMNGVGNIEKKMKEDRTFYDDIESLKNVIRERS